MSGRRFQVGDEVWSAFNPNSPFAPFRTRIVGFAGKAESGTHSDGIWLYRIPHPQIPNSDLMVQVWEPFLAPVSAVDLLGNLA